MRAGDLVKQIREMGIETITGIPDSTLKPFCEYIDNEGSSLFPCHVVPENEGAAVGIAVGEYLATGKPACVYMQNSGLGNAVNPLTSLAHTDVYGIPMLFIIGWRGEPGGTDEPQHKFMGRITTGLLETLEIDYSVIDMETRKKDLEQVLRCAENAFTGRKQYALVVKRGALEAENGTGYHNGHRLGREEAIELIVRHLNKEDRVVSTTGKISRELYEQCKRMTGNHDQAFLTVGGMGHASMIAFQLAVRQKERRVFCLDGDGALLMHMGSLAVLGRHPVRNLIHICLNNEAHESVGGMPTGAAGIAYSDVAAKTGYEKVYHVRDKVTLENILREMRRVEKMTFLEIEVSLDAREDLGRPKESPKENLARFMRHNEVTE